MEQLYLNEIITRALKEDMPYGDITTDNVFDEGHVSSACIVSKQEGIICGTEIAVKVFRTLDEKVTVEHAVEDGDPVSAGDIILELRGKTKALLKGERTALNFLQRLSGIATMTWDHMKEVEGFDVLVTDTRKTTPLLRRLEKYAVKTGGGTNHRFGLSDAVMLKDNHIEALGGVEKAVKILRKKIPYTARIEVEADTMEKVRQAVSAGADIIMLDNMSIDQMSIAVAYINKRAITEASGNMTKERLRDVAGTGVDVISVGRLTHSAQSLDISMKIRAEK